MRPGEPGSRRALPRQQSAFAPSEHASRRCSFALGLLISDLLYLLLLRGGGFFLLKTQLFNAPSSTPLLVLISWVKYSRLWVSWLMCGSLSKQVYIFFGKPPERRQLTEAKRKGETTFLRICRFSMKTSHSSAFPLSDMNHLITVSSIFAQTIHDMFILDNVLVYICL